MDSRIPNQDGAQEDWRSSLHEVLAAIRESAQGRAEYLRGKAERFNQGPDDYKQLMDREKTMIDLAEVMAGAIRRLAANDRGEPRGTVAHDNPKPL